MNSVCEGAYFQASLHRWTL